MTSTLLRDVIPIREQVFQGDFVLKLTDGVGSDLPRPTSLGGARP